MNKETINHHWNYFLNLEQDFINLTRFIEVNENNYNTYSFELSKLLQLSCAEIDTVYKILCKEIQPDVIINRNWNIVNNKNIILNKYPKLVESIINIPQIVDDIKPWLDWKTLDSPFWWRCYNNIKHNRCEQFNDANLKSVIYSLSALMILLLYLKTYNENDCISTVSKYFSSEYNDLIYSVRGNKKLPDFEL